LKYEKNVKYIFSNSVLCHTASLCFVDEYVRAIQVSVDNIFCSTEAAATCEFLFLSPPNEAMIRYYMAVFFCAQKLTDSQLGLPHITEKKTKNNEYKN